MVNFKEASHYKKLPNKKVHCLLCPHNCIIDNGEVGKCLVRMNINGSLKAMNYGKPHTVASKKIEEVPFYHFFPKTNILTIGAHGSNLKMIEEAKELPVLNQNPSQIIKQVEKIGVKIISYMYSEPIIFYEYVYDIASALKNSKHLIVTNGFIEPIPAKQLAGKIHGALIEIRSMNPSFYENIMGGKLEHVLKTLKIFHNNGIWVEIKMPLILGIHENFYDIRKLVSWVLDNLNSNVPIHFLGTNNIDSEIVKKARKIAMDAGINYSYTHKINFPEGNNTFCPNCKKLFIERNNQIHENKLNNIANGKCSCGKEIAGVWN